MGEDLSRLHAGSTRRPVDASGAFSATPDAFTPPAGNPRFPLFDSLRAIAALCILLLHTASFSGVEIESWYLGLLVHLDIGVTIFFLISGFLLYRPMVAARVLGAPATPWPAYAWRRFLRIAPAYWVALTILALLPGIYGVFTDNWWVYYGLLQNYPIYSLSADCSSDVLRCGITPVWSLGIEVGFYVALPFFAWGLGGVAARVRPSRWFTSELAVLAIVSLASLPLVTRFDTELERLLWYSPLGHGLWFALGMAIASASVRAQQTGVAPRGIDWLSKRPGLAWGAAIGAYAITSIWIFDPVPGNAVDGTQYAVQYVTFGLIAALLLLPAAFGDGRSGLPRRILASPVLAWLGLISYGIFLYHWPIAYALSREGVTEWWPHSPILVLTLVTLVLTVASATASYYLVERPILRLKRLGDSRAVRSGRGTGKQDLLKGTR